MHIPGVNNVAFSYAQSYHSHTNIFICYIAHGCQLRVFNIGISNTPPGHPIIQLATHLQSLEKGFHNDTNLGDLQPSKAGDFLNISQDGVYVGTRKFFFLKMIKLDFVECNNAD